MVVSGRSALLLLLAGVIAGTVGSAGGIISLVSYPALLAVGVPPLPANVANIVAGAALWPGTALSSQRELAGSGWWLPRALVVAAAGGTGGAVLLLTTPPGVFVRVVPLLLATGSFALLAQPWLTARRKQQARASPATTLALVAVLSVYAGYFGAGSGIMLLALLLVLVDDRLPQANAGKNMLLGAGALTSAAVYIVAGPVEWGAVVPLAAGLFAGGLVGPILARRLPASGVRWTVGVLGLIVALRLWFDPS